MDARTAVFGLILFLSAYTAARAAQDELYSFASDRPAEFEAFAASAPVFEMKMQNVLSAVVPHHLLAGPQLYAFFRALSAHSRGVKRIVIVGPDHFVQELPLVILSDLPWKTPCGRVENDSAVTASLSSSLPFAEVLSAVHNKEHSVSSLIPFAARFFPGIPVAPVIVKPWLDDDQVDALGDALASLPAGTLVILSTDFVHYKKKAETEALDAANERLIGERFRGGSGEGIRCDCVKGLSALFRFNGRIGLPRAEKVFYTNSHTITGKDEPGTSYFFYVFGRRE